MVLHDPTWLNTWIQRNFQQTLGTGYGPTVSYTQLHEESAPVAHC